MIFSINSDEAEEAHRRAKFFQRERTPTEIRIPGTATYVQTSSTRRTARILSEIHPVSHTAIWKWVKKFEQKLPVSTEKKQRNLIALDETVVKANRKRYYVYAAIDVERNEFNPDESLHDEGPARNGIFRKRNAELLRERA